MTRIDDIFLGITNTLMSGFAKQVECLTPVLSTSDVTKFSQNVASQQMTADMADPTVLSEVVESVKSLGRKVMIEQFPISKKATFDGSNADAFCKWLLDM